MHTRRGRTSTLKRAQSGIEFADIGEHAALNWLTIWLLLYQRAFFSSLWCFLTLLHRHRVPIINKRYYTELARIFLIHKNVKEEFALPFSSVLLAGYTVLNVNKILQSDRLCARRFFWYYHTIYVERLCCCLGSCCCCYTVAVLGGPQPTTIYVCIRGTSRPHSPNKTMYKTHIIHEILIALMFANNNMLIQADDRDREREIISDTCMRTMRVESYAVVLMLPIYPSIHLPNHLSVQPSSKLIIINIIGASVQTVFLLAGRFPTAPARVIRAPCSMPTSTHVHVLSCPPTTGSIPQ